MQIALRKPLIVVDGAHNRASVAAAIRAARELCPRRRLQVLLATTIGKDARGMVAELAANADEIILTERSKDERALPIADLIEITERLLDEVCSEDAPLRRKFRVVPDFRSYLADKIARGDSNDALLALGSFYFAAEVLKEIALR